MFSISPLPNNISFLDGRYEREGKPNEEESFDFISRRRSNGSIGIDMLLLIVTGLNAVILHSTFIVTPHLFLATVSIVWVCIILRGSLPSVGI